MPKDNRCISCTNEEFAETHYCLDCLIENHSKTIRKWWDGDEYYEVCQSCRHNVNPNMAYPFNACEVKRILLWIKNLCV